MKHYSFLQECGHLEAPLEEEMMMKKIKRNSQLFGELPVKSSSPKVDYVMISILMSKISNGKDGYNQ